MCGTNLEQSKKLMEFLPLETADLTIAEDLGGTNTACKPYLEVKKDLSGMFTEEQLENMETKIYPGWSLDSLLDILQKSKFIVDLRYDGINWSIHTMKEGDWNRFNIGFFKIDLLYEIIIDLNNRDLLDFGEELSIRDFTYDMTCQCCPEQYDIYDEDNKLVAYLRYRHGNLTVNPYKDEVYEGTNEPVIDFETVIYKKDPNLTFLNDGSFTEKERSLVFKIVNKALTLYLNEHKSDNKDKEKETK